MFANPFIDETFEIYNCQNYILSIQCALDGFSFSVYDTSVNKFIVFNEYDINTTSAYELSNVMRNIIHNDKILNQQYQKVNIAYVSTKYIITPIVLVPEIENNLFIKNSFEIERTEQIITTKLNSELEIQFAIPNILVELFNKQYSNCIFFNIVSPLLNHAKNLIQGSNQILVHIHNHTLFIIILNNEQIVFHNSFFVKNETDCLYYILNTLKQLEVDSKTEIFLSGKLKPKSELELSLKKYIEKVYLTRFSSNYSVSYTLYKEPENYHISTLELALCE